ncbi:MAG: ATP-dependent DNA helicase RecQ [Alkalibacterium sp.]|nr:ATP-dependent DNA helicase RecQ [Alkalibacterium sp.]TVP92535.1 MAG: ATP-dependent DNA helicase RecQ [Alkalibacterium sp.]
MTEDVKEEMFNVLQAKFGFDSFRPGQEEAVEAAVNGCHSLVMLPTGTGKTLCYQLPSYLKSGHTLIVTPLLSLMEDQVDNMKKNGEKSVVALNSFMSYKEKKQTLKRLDDYKFIFTSPEMLQQNQVVERLKSLSVTLLVVDEAHCISHWGMDFRPDYLKLGEIRSVLGNPLTMALTATAVSKVRKEIISSLGIGSRLKEIVYSVDRPDIQLRVMRVEKDKDTRLLEMVSQLSGSGIVYFSSKKKADKIAALIRSELNLTAESYHSDLSPSDKRKTQSQFIHNRLQIICATSAFGMGIDKADIRFVIHYHLPSSPEMYLQEIGRCSRDGEGGMACLLYEAGDEYIQRRLQEDSLPTTDELAFAYKNEHKLKDFEDDHKAHLASYFIKQRLSYTQANNLIQERLDNKSSQLKTLIDYAQSTNCLRENLLNYFNESVEQRKHGCCSNCTKDLIVPFSETLKDASQWSNEQNWYNQIKMLFNL